MAIYVWDSNATDVTGRNIAEGLRGTESRIKPRVVSGDIVIGWGTKINEDTEFADNITVINHPNAIRKNRNKFTALELMSSDEELNHNIKKFCKANSIFTNNGELNLELPLIGRKNYHQGGENFWLCLTKFQVAEAIGEGAQYFQEYIDIKDEYRLHVFGNTIIYAVKKVENATKEGWVTQRIEKVSDYAQKNNVNIDDATLNYVLGIIYGEQQLPDKIVRSNKRGWKFSSVRLNTLSNNLKTAAIKAINVIGLDFGAVDCCIDADDNAFIIEVNSAPGLQGTTLTKYLEAFQAKINTLRVANNARGSRVNRDMRVNAAAANDNVNEINVEQFKLMMGAVRSPEEARRIIDLLMMP